MVLHTWMILILHAELSLSTTSSIFQSDVCRCFCKICSVDCDSFFIFFLFCQGTALTLPSCFAADCLPLHCTHRVKRKKKNRKALALMTKCCERAKALQWLHFRKKIKEVVVLYNMAKKKNDTALPKSILLLLAYCFWVVRKEKGVNPAINK